MLTLSISKNGRFRAELALKHFKSPLPVFTASAEELQKVEGIGEKLAAGMKEALESKYKARKP